jgi:hypothetical protein
MSSPGFDRATQHSRDASDQSRSRGVLDAPLSPSMTACYSSIYDKQEIQKGEPRGKTAAD